MFHYRTVLLACGVLGLGTVSRGQDSASDPPAPIIRPGDNLTVVGIPEVPVSLADAVRRYTEARAASVLDWHPTQRSMLISTRFANASQVHRVQMPLGARFQLTFFSEPVGAATYEPQSGSYFLFTKDTGGNEFAQIHRYDVATGTTTLLTDGGRSQNGRWVWNHAKNRIAYMSTRRNGADRDVWVMDPGDAASDRMLIECSGGGWSVCDWSPDDTRLLVMEYLSINKSCLYLADVHTARREPLTDRTAEVSYGDAVFAADGRGIYLTSDAAGEFQQLGWMDLETRHIDWLSREIPWDVERIELSPDGRRLALIANEAGISGTFVMDTSTREIRKVEGFPAGVAGLGPWRADSSEFAITLSSARSSADIYSVDGQSLQPTRWTESEMGGLVSSELSEPELVQWKSFDERVISGFLYRPAKRFTGRRPVIINIHGGPEGQARPTFLGRNNYFLNELGCAILYPNVRGSAGYGKSFLKLDNGLLRLDSVRDIGALLDWISTQDQLDSQRILITGGSYGGYMTLACAVEYNERIACALDVVGISHFGTFLKHTEDYRRDLRRAEYGDERLPEMAAFFDTIAPLNNAHKISKPLFVVQGGNDPRVPLSEAEQMVTKVQENGTPVWYLMANDEGHGFRKKNNADFQFYATVEFVKRYLLADGPSAPANFALTVRHRVPVAEGSGQHHMLTQSERWPAAQTAVIVCDVWDSHHCLNAVRRVQEMAPRMNEFLREARRRGALIIHAPSDCMQAYEGHPARRRAQEAPRAANLPADIGQWCHSIPAEERGVYPIDQSDGGEDDDPQEHAQWEAQLKAEGRNPDAPWKKQIDVLQICDEDAISDRGEEVWNLLEQRGIQHVMLLGVHTNMCVLGRPFGLRQLAKNGKRVVLVRDLTDTMYNPQRSPFVQHHSGTDLIVEHIEKYVCPTITSDQLLGGKPFRFSTDRRQHVAVVMSEDEYKTEQTLTQFARECLQRDFRLSFFYADARDIQSLPGIEQLAQADVAIVSVRRRALPTSQLDVFRKFVADGKPIVALRTASHAFALRDGQPPDGHDVWPEFDRDVLGGNYQGHHGNHPGQGATTRVWMLPAARDQAVMQGLPDGEWTVSSWLYKTQPLGPRAVPLMMGRVEDRLPQEPVTWTNTHIGGGRVFYTSLGHPDDFQMPAFRRLLWNGVYWAAGLEIPMAEVDGKPRAVNDSTTNNTNEHE